MFASTPLCQFEKLLPNLWFSHRQEVGALLTNYLGFIFRSDFRVIQNFTWTLDISLWINRVGLPRTFGPENSLKKEANLANIWNDELQGTGQSVFSSIFCTGFSSLLLHRLANHSHHADPLIITDVLIIPAELSGSSVLCEPGTLNNGLPNREASTGC